MSDRVLHAENTSYVPLVFERHGEKLYARTPRGEIAHGEAQGLYEWRHGKRIDYTGGDRPAALDGEWLDRSHNFYGRSARREGLLEAARRALDRVATPRRYKKS